MKKLFSNLTKKDLFIIAICIVFIFCQVWLELRLPDYMSKITVLIRTEGSSIKDVLTQGLYMVLCSLGSLATAIFVGYLTTGVSSTFSMNIRKKIFDKVESFSTAEIKKFQTSSLITRTTNDVTMIEMFISLGLQAMIKAPIMAVWAVTKIINKSMEWSALIGGCVVILLLSSGIIMAIVLPRFALVQKLIDKVNGVTRENLTGIRVIRAFNAEKFQERRFNEVNEELTKAQLFNQRCFALMNPIMNTVMNSLSVGIYFIGAILISHAVLMDKLTLFSDMIVFVSYGMQVIMAFLMLGMIFMILPRAQISARRINEVLEEELSIVDGTFDGKTKEKGTVEFKNVSFKYPDADEYILENVSFKANKGETVAFIGSTGSGKSTLINLVPRFYDATSGTILVDGVNVKDYKQEALNNKLGYVSQKAFMFTASVKENVSYGNDSIPLKKIKEAIKIAQGEDFVTKMENSYDSNISRGGTNVSGGQKQRISIARAIAKTPEIYIFDDSFSALDFKTDAELRKSLKEYTKDATCLIVAQRIGTIMNADKIVVLDKGKCVGIGTHKELLKNCSIYKEIALSQLGSEDLNHA
ncbi:MAG: ABC transporter ATP-binding protein [Bacilli bacterium]